MLSVATSTVNQLSTLSLGQRTSPFPIATLKRQVTVDRLSMSSEYLRSGDMALRAKDYRTAICRYYYAMYHAARGVVFSFVGGDDHQKHSVLPGKLPPSIPNQSMLESKLQDARILRNQADYDPYPMNINDWETDARNLSAEASSFVSQMDSFARQNGLI